MISQKNSFAEKDTILFKEAFECWNCGKNKADAMHHIVGRGLKDNDVESSPLNGAPLCNQNCHINQHAYLMTTEVKRRLLAKTYDFLTMNGYKFQERDVDFITKYVDLYS